MTDASRIQRAKKKLLAATAALAGSASVGIAKVGSEVGLVVSVPKGGRAQAERRIKGLELGVPIEVREVGPVRARRKRPS